MAELALNNNHPLTQNAEIIKTNDWFPLLVPDGIICPIVSASTLLDTFIIEIYSW
jgi:hypothetical protein